VTERIHSASRWFVLGSRATENHIAVLRRLPSSQPINEPTDINHKQSRQPQSTVNQTHTHTYSSPSGVRSADSSQRNQEAALHPRQWIAPARRPSFAPITKLQASFSFSLSRERGRGPGFWEEHDHTARLRTRAQADVLLLSARGVATLDGVLK
jgi:hypothetical protein